MTKVRGLWMKFVCKDVLMIPYFPLKGSSVGMCKMYSSLVFTACIHWQWCTCTMLKCNKLVFKLSIAKHIFVGEENLMHLPPTNILHVFRCIA